MAFRGLGAGGTTVPSEEFPAESEAGDVDILVSRSSLDEPSAFCSLRMGLELMGVGMAALGVIEGVEMEVKCLGIVPIGLGAVPTVFGIVPIGSGNETFGVELYPNPAGM